ncbi:hypothetical protein ACM7NY_02195 [Pseudomonas aeruginosa]
MSKHTRGKWMVLDCRQHDRPLQRLTISNGEHVICRIENTVSDHPIDSQDEANAALLAAAPDLLEALMVMLVAYDDGVGREDESGLNWEWPIWQKAKAAIAKATA